MTLADCFSGCFVINLPERLDRRREMERELVGARLPAGWAEFYPAVRPSTADGFPSVGARGCFLSHLGVLREALARGWESVLILEDDLTFAPELAATVPAVAAAAQPHEWDLMYLGHPLPALSAEVTGFRAHTGPIVTAHFFAVSRRCLPDLIRFLETVLSRPPGHPAGGPMHVDGAYSTYRSQTPRVTTLVAATSLGHQRSSRSDITSGWKDKTPLVRDFTALARRVYNRLKARPES